ncbi:MAG: sensor histidine kinase [Velocimicrobium sp.]
MITAVGFINYGLILLFGILLSIDFAGIEQTHKNRLVVNCFILSLLIVQFASWRFFGYDITRKIYPFIVHIPLMLFISFYYKQNFIVAFVSVLSAYLCCQTPRWFATMALYLFNSKLSYLIVNSLAIFPVLFLLKKYVVRSINQLINISKRSLLLFGIVPLMYYLFDYTTTVYTNLLYRGIEMAVLFMPTLVSMFYFIFTLIYYNEMQRRSNAERESIILSIQVSQAKIELSKFLESQEKTAIYRHDMRHHLNLIGGYLETGDITKASEYISNTQADIKEITPIHYCENSTINLILSYFAGKAKTVGITFFTDVNIPQDISILETELCALLSNSLENAILACTKVSETNARIVRVICQLHKDNMLIFIENNYNGNVEMINGLPQNHSSGHGFGVKSSMTIVNKYKGYCSYTAIDGIFTVKIVLPMKKVTQKVAG